MNTEKIMDNSFSGNQGMDPLISVTKPDTIYRPVSRRVRDFSLALFHRRSVVGFPVVQCSPTNYLIQRHLIIAIITYRVNPTLRPPFHVFVCYVNTLLNIFWTNLKSCLHRNRYERQYRTVNINLYNFLNLDFCNIFISHRG